MDMDAETQVIDRAMTLAADDGWQSLPISRIARAANLSLDRFYRLFPSKTAILTRLMARTDAAVLTGVLVWSDQDTPRDRLFDLLMRRFDALGPYRPGLAAVIPELVLNPPALVHVGRTLHRSMARTLVAAGLDSPGCRAQTHAIALTGIYLLALRTWLTDDSTDQAPTMAALDRGLEGAERLMAWRPPRLS